MKVFPIELRFLVSIQTLTLQTITEYQFTKIAIHIQRWGKGERVKGIFSPLLLSPFSFPPFPLSTICINHKVK